MARKRRAMSKKESKKVFSKGNRVNPKNIPVAPMRGGIRL